MNNSHHTYHQYTIKPKGIVIVRDNSESELDQSVVIEMVNTDLKYMEWNMDWKKWRHCTWYGVEYGLE